MCRVFADNRGGASFSLDGSAGGVAGLRCERDARAEAAIIKTRLTGPEGRGGVYDVQFAGGAVLARCLTH